MGITKHQQNRFQRHVVQVTRAQELIKSYIVPTNKELIPLEQSYGKYLAKDVFASEPLPHFRRSGMDGYSIRTEDLRGASTFSPVRLKVIENVPCGFVPQERLKPGTVARTMTGAQVSEGADAVIRLEMTQEMIIAGEPYITVTRSVKPGENVSEIGSELAKGELVLKKGCKIRSGESALLATYGYHQVPVHRSPVVAVLSTGTELMRVDEPLQPGKIRNSNAHMLAGLIKNAGGIPLCIGQIGDNLEEANYKIRDALEMADLIVSTGGVSVGDYDILTDFFQQWRGKTLFNKVAMRPGSPTTVGLLDGTFCFALSGNPGACFVGFQLFVRPVLLGMQGCSNIYLSEIPAVLLDDYPKTDAFTRYVRGQTVFSNDGRVLVQAVGLDKSSVLTSIKDSDCLICIPPTKESLPKGSLVSVLRLNTE